MAEDRSAWYIQIFNICNWTLAMLAACAELPRHRQLSGSRPARTSGTRWPASRRAAAMVAVNHLLMAPMLHLARGHSLRESGLFSFPSLSTDLVLAMLGVAMAAFWVTNPWLIPFAVAPLLLIHRSLSCRSCRGGARRPQDRPVQRAALRRRPERGAPARRALRAAPSRS
jgi:hypothetical protein